jgi:hypothetical protein
VSVGVVLVSVPGGGVGVPPLLTLVSVPGGVVVVPVSVPPAGTEVSDVEVADVEVLEEEEEEEEELLEVVGGRLHVPSVLIVLSSKVTAPFRANKPPSEVDPVTRVIDVTASTFPTKFVPDPSVAELPIAQKTLHACAPLINATLAFDAVVSAEPIWKTQAAFALPCASRVKVPVRPADEPYLYTPATSVFPPRSPVRVVAARPAATLYAFNASACAP